MIRVGVSEDIPSLVQLGKDFLKSTILADIAPYDGESMATTLIYTMDNESGAVFVLEIDGEIVGGIFGLIVPLYWNLSILAAQQFGYYVHPRYRGSPSLKLLGAWEKWAESKGAEVFFSGAKKNTEFERMDIMLTRRNYIELETVHVKGVRTCPQQ